MLNSSLASLKGEFPPKSPPLKGDSGGCKGSGQPKWELLRTFWRPWRTIIWVHPSRRQLREVEGECRQASSGSRGTKETSSKSRDKTRDISQRAKRGPPAIQTDLVGVRWCREIQLPDSFVTGASWSLSAYVQALPGHSARVVRWPRGLGASMRIPVPEWQWRSAWWPASHNHPETMATSQSSRSARLPWTRRPQRSAILQDLHSDNGLAASWTST